MTRPCLIPTTKTNITATGSVISVAFTVVLTAYRSNRADYGHDIRKEACRRFCPGVHEFVTQPNTRLIFLPQAISSIGKNLSGFPPLGALAVSTEMESSIRF